MQAWQLMYMDCLLYILRLYKLLSSKILYLGQTKPLKNIVFVIHKKYIRQISTKKDFEIDLYTTWTLDQVWFGFKIIFATQKD